MEEILRYSHVDISYNGHKVVNDISFSLGKAEILGIVGESGSGKSTLIKATMGLLGKGGLVTRGDIWYKNKNLPDLSARELRQVNGTGIGMIFQNCATSFCPIRTIGDQIYESFCAHGKMTRSESDQKAIELLSKLGFHNGDELLKRYTFELSGGMNQRMGIASAMLLSPDILLADEPTSALDSVSQRRVVEEMMKIRDEFGTSIIIVSHNIGVIGAMSDRVLVMKKGQLVEMGTAEEVLENPTQEYTKTLLSAVPRLRR